MNYQHLSIEESSCIRKYYVDGLSYREIARLMGRNVSTVSREIRRNCTHMYDIPTLLSAHSSKEVSAAALLLPSWDVSFAGSDRLHQREVESDLVARTDRLHAVRVKDAWLANDLPLDLRKILGKRESQSPAAQGKEPRHQGNSREIQQREIHPQTGQVGIQSSGGRALGSGYGCERPGKKQSLLRHLGREKDKVLYCR